MTQDTLHSYFTGSATEQQRREILSWVEESPANKAEFLEREADFVFDSMPDAEASQAATTHMLNVISPKRRKIRILNAVASAAAVFVIGAFIWLLHDNSRLNEQVLSLTAQNEKLIAIPELEQGESTPASKARSPCPTAAKSSSTAPAPCAPPPATRTASG